MSRQTLILAEFVLPVRPAQAVWVDHAVLLEEDRILAVLPREQALQQHPDALRIELPGHVLVPGLINMHTHSPMSLMRGMADDLALDTWLKQHIWPAEQQWLSPEFVRDGTRLAMAEMLRGGTTCFNDMYFYPGTMAETAAEAGMRAMIGVPIIELQTPWATGLEDCLDKAVGVQEWAADLPLLDVSLAPHAIYTVSEHALQRVAELSEAWDVSVAMHVLEVSWERQFSQSTHGMGVLEWLENFDLLGDRFHAVHMVHLEGPDIDRVVRSGTHVIHCPKSNLKLASGVASTAALLSAGANLSIGTDGAASNNRLDLLGEARVASLLAKGASGDPCVMDAHATLESITLSAARALRKSDQLGSIEAGKQADLAAFDLRAPETQPLHDVASQLIYAAAARQCTQVWVAGRRLLQDGALCTLDLDAIMERAGHWNRQLAREATA